MKIALIGATLFHQGAEYVLATIARGLFNRGHEVTVILSKYHEDIEKNSPKAKPFELSEGIRVVILPVRKASCSLFHIRQTIKDNSFDVVMSHSCNYSYAIALATIGLRKRPKLIHVEHSGLVGVNRSGEVVRPTFSLKKWIADKLMSFMTAQIAVSKGTADAIARMSTYPRNKIFNICNPVIDDTFLMKKSRTVDVPGLNKPHDYPIVMAAGAFNSLKNYSILIDAFSQVLKYHDARLVIFGDGPLRNSYEEQAKLLGISDKVLLPGHTNNLPAMLKSASCFVVSSKVESFSIVLVEALACGVPVVATDCPYGPKEILQNGSFGVLVENKNEKALAEGIIRVLEGKGVIPTQQMVEPYSINNVLHKYEAVMAKVCECL